MLVTRIIFFEATGWGEGGLRYLGCIKVSPKNRHTVKKKPRYYIQSDQFPYKS